MARLSPESEARFFAALEAAGEFFAGRAPVQAAMAQITRRLDEMQIPYAIVGGMALNEIGYERVTQDGDILLPREGFDRFKQTWLGRGYVGKSTGKAAVRDTENDVVIEVVFAGDYPGEREPTAVRFPHPTIAEPRARVRVLPLERLLELKLASGISAPHRLRDLADVLEVIRIRALPRDFGERLDGSVRAKYDELWIAAQGAPGEE